MSFRTTPPLPFEQGMKIPLPLPRSWTGFGGGGQSVVFEHRSSFRSHSDLKTELRRLGEKVEKGREVDRLGGGDSGLWKMFFWPFQ